MTSARLIDGQINCKILSISNSYDMKIVALKKNKKNAICMYVFNPKILLNLKMDSLPMRITWVRLSDKGVLFL